MSATVIYMAKCSACDTFIGKSNTMVCPGCGSTFSRRVFTNGIRAKFNLKQSND